MTIKVTELYAWMMVGPDDNGNDIEEVAFIETAGGVPFPLTAPKERAEWMEPIARAVAGQHGRTVKLAKFTKREDVKVIEP